MKRIVLFLSLFGLLFLTACSKDEGIAVYNADNQKVGTIQVIDDNNAQFLSVNGEERGKLRGGLVRDEGGARKGTIIERDGHFVITNAEQDEIGSLENGKDCFGKGKAVIGRISEETDKEAAAGACLVFLLK